MWSMAYDDHKQDARREYQDDRLDRALAKYTAVEPRAGLESRILANLQAAGEHRVGVTRWGWIATAFALVAIVAAASLVWRSEKPRPGLVAHDPSGQIHEERLGQVESTGGDSGIRSPLRVPVHGSRQPGPRVRAGAIPPPPKLDQFPSPRPLSEQEQILARYVAMYPAHATMIAQARADALRREAAEEAGSSAGGADNSQPRAR